MFNSATERGLLHVEDCKWDSLASNYKAIKNCSLEHSYFACLNTPKTNGGNLKCSLEYFTESDENTLEFENEIQLEQQTIDFKCLLPEEVKSTLTKDAVKDCKELNDKKDGELSESDRSGCGSNTDDSFVDDCKLESNCFSDENSTSREECDTSSVASDDSGDDDVKHLWKVARPNSDVSDVSESFNVRKLFTSFDRLEESKYSKGKEIPDRFVSVHELLARLKDMQKLIKTKYEKKIVGDSGKIPPPKLKKIVSRGKGENLPKMSEYLFPMPTLTKMTTGNKGWKTDCLDNDIQSLGLDDLLLKASELNAENFTKALGRKLDSGKTNFSRKDGSEIVLTIPKSKKNVSDLKQNCENSESDCSKRSNLKSMKIDFSNSFFDSTQKSEDGSHSKILEELSSKVLGIKVKTVENINEEFKDSESKRKVFKENIQVVADLLASENRKELRNCNGLVAVSKGHQRNESQRNSQDLEATDKETGENRPFIMTIIQGKMEKQRPAILRNSSYFKKKTGLKSVPKSAERLNDDGGTADGFSGENFSENKALEGTKLDFLNSENSNKHSSGSSFSDSLAGGSKALDQTAEEDARNSSGGEGVNKTKFPVKKKNVPFILNRRRKSRQGEVTDSEPAGKVMASCKTSKATESVEKGSGSDKVFRVTSVEQKLGPKEANKRFIKVVPYEPTSQTAKAGGELQSKHSDEDSEKGFGKEVKSNQVLSLRAFSKILKEILPEKWVLCLDKKYGLQIMKTHIDEMLNPSITISLVIGSCGKLTVNVRGKPLEKSHQLFSNLCNIGNSENKLSLNYILSIINKLRYLSVCFGCDLSLKKYWCSDDCSKDHVHIRQAHRSLLCRLLVSLGKKRCYPCYRINESLKKRSRRGKTEEKERREETAKESSPNEVDVGGKQAGNSVKSGSASRGMKRNLEDFLEESFTTMKQQIADEIEKNKKMGEREQNLKAQEEVLSFMGLARKDTLGSTVRKSKRMKNSFNSQQQPTKKSIDQKELEFLQKYWTDINTLFSTSLLFGAYSRTGRSRLREKCRMFHELLSTWRGIVQSNPEWIGGEIIFPDSVDNGSSEVSSSSDQFEKMDVTALRSYIINSVKEVNRIKHKLRTRNSYFKILYNKFVKRRMKRPKSLSSSVEKKESSSANSTANNTPTDLSSDDSSRDKGKAADTESAAVGDVTEAPEVFGAEAVAGADEIIQKD